MSTIRGGGTLSIRAGGVTLSLAGSLEIQPMTYTREGVPSHTGPPRHKRVPLVPYISGDVHYQPGSARLSDLAALEGATVQADLYNGATFVLSEAWTEGETPLDGDEGTFSIRFSGTGCQEIAS